MEKLNLKFVNCHGIRELDAEFEFTDKHNSVAVYAPNGTMKTSFARTFADLSTQTDSRDRVFADRETTREILDETGDSIDGSNVVVVLSYDEERGPTESTSTLLVNRDLRREYEEIQKDLLKVQDELIAVLKTQAKTKTNVADAVSLSFMQETGNFFEALMRVRQEVENQEGAPLADVPYDTIFNRTIETLLQTPAIREALTDYVTRLNELLDQSTFFSRDTFTFYNADKVTKSLGDNGFFDASHSLLLKGGSVEEQSVSSSADLQKLIDGEKQQITQDDMLRKKMDVVEKALNKNPETRAFFKYISEHVEFLPELMRYGAFAQKVWKSYFKSHEELYNQALDCFSESQDRKKAIEEQAVKERTQWQRVIDIFNDRFYVPFELVATNHAKVVLGQEPLLKLGFAFRDGEDRRDVERGELLEVLSNGEKKALYILNVLFEVETRKNSEQSTMFVIDDIADSFDYKNKYAIVHYLKEMSEHASFRLVLLTHNFDFFRTLNSRGIAPSNRCFMAQKGGNTLTLEPAADLIRNPFITDFKLKFHEDPMSRAACIPFIRNILEYTNGTSHPSYLKLTSLLHWKSETPNITNADLDDIFGSTFSQTGEWTDSTGSVVDLILSQAQEALDADEGINFANKLVLSIAIRLEAERFMIREINDHDYVNGITGNQTIKLLRKYKKLDTATPESLQVLDLVVLMTPENIHFNSFMYEPIIDLSDAHLRDLFRKVLALPGQA